MKGKIKCLLLQIIFPIFGNLIPQSLHISVTCTTLRIHTIKNVFCSSDENMLDGVMYAAWLLLDEYYTRGEYAMIGECRHLLTKRCRAELHSAHNREFCTGFYTIVDSVLSI